MKQKPLKNFQGITLRNQSGSGEWWQGEFSTLKRRKNVFLRVLYYLAVKADHWNEVHVGLPERGILNGIHNIQVKTDSRASFVGAKLAVGQVWKRPKNCEFLQELRNSKQNPT